MSGATFQAAVNRALGAIARSFGRPYAVYRLLQNSTGDFPDGWSWRTSQAVMHRNRISPASLEIGLSTARALWYEIAGDVNPFLIGDVFVATDLPAASNTSTKELDGFALAWSAVGQIPIGGRLDRRVGIYRPLLAPATVNGVKRWNVTHEQDTPLILSNGVYGWGAAGAAASWVPCGFGSNDREFRGGAFMPDKIGTIGDGRYFAYLPPLPGYVPAEGDALITEDDARYVVSAPYAQAVGVVGSQLMIERLISGQT